MSPTDFRMILREAFSTAERPERVTSPLAEDVHPGAPRIRQALTGRDWWTLPADLLDDTAADLLALTPQSFRYFLPAYLARAWDDPAGPCATYAFYALAPLAHFDTFYERTCEMFTRDEAAAVAMTLRRLQESPSFEPLVGEVEPAARLWDRRAGDCGPTDPAP